MQGPPYQTNTKCLLKGWIKKLFKLDVKKVSGPDSIPTWVRKYFSGHLAEPIAATINSSFREGLIPHTWKCATMVTGLSFFLRLR